MPGMPKTSSKEVASLMRHAVHENMQANFEILTMSDEEEAYYEKLLLEFTNKEPHDYSSIEVIHDTTLKK